jgi:GT2 family glycosyltransferase
MENNKLNASTLLSVMIPYYNRFDLLSEALHSVMSQRIEEKMEVWVIDDCSTVEGVSSVLELFPKGSILYYRQLQNVGQINNLNKCIELANGELIHILHCDDKVLPGFYSTIIEAYSEHKEAGAFFTRNNYITHFGNIICESEALMTKSGYIENWFEKIAVSQLIQTPSIVVRRDVYGAIGNFNKNLTWTEDWEMWVRISKTYPMFYINEVLAEYRNANNSNSENSFKTGRFIDDLRRAINVNFIHHQSKFLKRKSILKYSSYILTNIYMLRKEKKINSMTFIKLLVKFNKNNFSIVFPLIQFYFIYIKSFKTKMLSIWR